jgi:signal transduction histidine kinase
VRAGTGNLNKPISGESATVDCPTGRGNGAEDGKKNTPAAMNLAKVCEDLVEEVCTFYPDHRIVLNMGRDLEVTWDSARISQAFSNLIANAIQHGSKTDPVTITVSVEDEVVVWTFTIMVALSLRIS